MTDIETAQGAGELSREGAHRSRQIRSRCTADRSKRRTHSGPSRPRRSSTGTHAGTRCREADFIDGRFAWFKGAKLNASYNCIDRHLKTRGDQVAIIWEGDDPTLDAKHHLSRAASARLPTRERAEESRRQKRRSRLHLHADDPRSRVRDARVRADRRDSLGRVRRLFPAVVEGPHPRFGLPRRDHGRRRRPRRTSGPAEEEHRRGARALSERPHGADGEANRRRHSVEDRAATSGITTWSPRSPTCANRR